MLPECQDKVDTIRYNLIQFNTKWYLFEISQNYIVKCFSSRFAIILYQIDYIKPIILYSKRYKTKFFWIQLVQNQDSVWKSRWNQYFAYKLIFLINDRLHSEKKILIISIWKFKRYLSENCHFHIVLYHINIKSCLIISYQFLVSHLAHPCNQYKFKSFMGS